MKNKLKIMILHNIVTPYRLPLFEELCKKYDLTVYFCKEKAEDRKWSVSLKDYSFKYKILQHKDLGPFIINPTLKDELKKNNFDIYSAFENPENAFSVLKTRKFARKNKKPFILINGRKDDEIYTLKDLKESKNIFKNIFYFFSKWSYKKYREFIYRKSASFASYCQVATSYIISKTISKDKVFTGIQNYPECLLSRPTWKLKPKEFKNKKILFYLGYLRKGKGVEYLIQAFNKLNRKDTLLLIAGTNKFKYAL